MHINVLAVVAAAAASWVLGALWYSPALFVKPWRAEIGVPPDAKPDFGKMAPQLVGSFIIALVQAGSFAFFLGRQTIALGAAYGLVAGLCWVAAFLALVYMFEGRSLRLLAINGGYAVVSFVLYGVILAAWP
jgi:hypothetical protein